MLLFTKDKKTFGRVGLEILSASPKLKNISFIGVDLESAIFTRLKTVIPGLCRLICVRHLMKADESKLEDLLPKAGRNIADRKLSLSEILKDIYGSKVANFYEYGIAEAIDPDDFNAKLESLEDRWEALSPGFHQWFVRNRKFLFLESVIQSKKLNSDSTGLYYQNDIESIHASEKRYQNFKKESIEVALSNIQKIIQRKENDKIRALYGANNYCLSPEYQKFHVASHVRHSWSEERKADHLKTFREYVPNISDTFHMPANAGRKPSYQHRDRNTTEPDIVVDRIEKSTSGNSQHCTTPCTISFRDPRATAEKEFELYHRKHLPKSISKCQGNCGRPIKVEEVMVVPSYGRITWTDKSTGKEKAKFVRCTYTFMTIVSRTSVRHSMPLANHLIFQK